MTLMPVSNISMLVDCSSNGGGSRWIDQRSSELTGPLSSTGSPRTLRMRPSVSRPTGTDDRRAGVDRLHAADHAVGRLHGDAAHDWFSPMWFATSATTSIGTLPSSPLSTMRTAL